MPGLVMTTTMVRCTVFLAASSSWTSAHMWENWMVILWTCWKDPWNQLDDKHHQSLMMRFVKSLLFSSTFVLLATAQRVRFEIYTGEPPHFLLYTVANILPREIQGNNDNRPRLPSLWEIILMPSSSQNGGPSNYNNARSTSTTESSTKKLNVGSSRGERVLSHDNAWVGKCILWFMWHL